MTRENVSDIELCLVSTRAFLYERLFTVRHKHGAEVGLYVCMYNSQFVQWKTGGVSSSMCSFVCKLVTMPVGSAGFCFQNNLRFIYRRLVVDCRCSASN